MSIEDVKRAWEVEAYVQDATRCDVVNCTVTPQEKITQLERVNKEWEALWKPIDDLVRPLTPLGESVGDKAVELIRDCLEREPAFWYNPTAKNSVISNASKRTKGTTHLYADWSVPLYD